MALNPIQLHPQSLNPFLSRSQAQNQALVGDRCPLAGRHRHGSGRRVVVAERSTIAPPTNVRASQNRPSPKTSASPIGHPRNRGFQHGPRGHEAVGYPLEPVQLIPHQSAAVDAGWASTMLATLASCARARASS